MKLQLNGNSHKTDVDTLKELFEEIHPDSSADGKAIAVNDEVIPSDEWDSFILSDGDRVEVIQAVQGG